MGDVAAFFSRVVAASGKVHNQPQANTSNPFSNPLPGLACADIVACIVAYGDVRGQRVERLSLIGIDHTQNSVTMLHRQPDRMVCFLSIAMVDTIDKQFFDCQLCT